MWNVALTDSKKWRPCALVHVDKTNSTSLLDDPITRYYFPDASDFHECSREPAHVHTKKSTILPVLSKDAAISEYIDRWHPWSFQYLEEVLSTNEDLDLLTRSSLLGVYPLLLFHGLCIVVFVDSQMGIIVSSRWIKCTRTRDCAFQLHSVIDDVSPAHTLVMTHAESFLKSIESIQRHYSSITRLCFIGQGLGGAIAQTLLALYLNHVVTPSALIRLTMQEVHLVTFNSFGVHTEFRDLSCHWLLKFFQFYRSTSLTMVHVIRATDFAHRGHVFVCQQPTWIEFPPKCTLAIVRYHGDDSFGSTKPPLLRGRSVARVDDTGDVELRRRTFAPTATAFIDEEVEDHTPYSEQTQMQDSIYDYHVTYKDRHMQWASNHHENHQWLAFLKHLNCNWTLYFKEGMHIVHGVIASIIPGFDLLNQLAQRTFLFFLRKLFKNFLLVLSGDDHEVQTSLSRRLRNTVQNIIRTETQLLLQAAPSEFTLYY